MRLIFWNPLAEEDRDTILDYLKARNPGAALAVADLIEKNVGALPDNPERGRPGRIPGTRELVFHPNYQVIYEVTPEYIEILSVVHSRQQYP
ncbi:type II toxin-antitoxin system RelE/ParE family toxin [Pseudoxanthomonas putridarboris]|uniref:Type II toxin-antitoxin system RelE/ParE family toxin n=1 Tax=Pseudoxanthomonas putridarboris TaxID=752605 RepID=A0ABU9J3S6_9GAMM